MQKYRQILYPFLIPLSWIYGCIIWIRNQLYDLGWIKGVVFNKPIISIGNITSGGTGKTPMVIYLAQLLQKNGKKPGIISRGYGRKSQGLQVVHNGKKLIASVEMAGDEPFLMANMLKNVPIIVSKNRIKGIKQLIDYYFVDVIIMDDGFQHRKVNRNLDILTISSNDKKIGYRLFPWGNLREPLKNINRANYVIYTKTVNHKTPAIHSEFQPFLKTSPINSSLLPILMKYNASSYKKSPPPDKPIFAFCGIAEPNSFINSAKELSLKIKGRNFFQDHQEYTEAVIKELSEQIKVCNINQVVTTEKDMVKLPESFLTEFEVYVIKIDVIFKNESAFQAIIKPILLN